MGATVREENKQEEKSESALNLGKDRDRISEENEDSEDDLNIDQIMMF